MKEGVGIILWASGAVINVIQNIFLKEGGPIFNSS